MKYKREEREARQDSRKVGRKKINEEGSVEKKREEDERWGEKNLEKKGDEVA